MGDGGFEHCAKGQAEACQSNRNSTTCLLPSKRLSFAKKRGAVGASRRREPISTKNSECGCK